MKIYVTSVFVEDQELAHDFYTKKLGFNTKHDIPRSYGFCGVNCSIPFPNCVL